MSYIQQQLDKITVVLENNGCGLYPTDVKLVGKIIAEAIIAANLDSSLIEEAVKYFEDDE